MKRFGVEAGAQLNADIDNWTLSVGYDLDIRRDYISHTGMMKARYNF